EEWWELCGVVVLQVRGGLRVAAELGDATALPLEEGSLDVVLCDLPFGKQFGSVLENKELYPQALQEWGRIVRVGAGALCAHPENPHVTVLLTSDANEALMTAQLSPGGMAAQWWRLVGRHPVALGSMMPAHIYLLRRVGADHEDSIGCDELLASAGWNEVKQGKGRWRKFWKQSRPPMVTCWK
ncbi:hypothetical protein CYMTET_54299, partial [Cymbomonas tetramitiformis]